MKTNKGPQKKQYLPTFMAAAFVLLLSQQGARAQVPDCLSGTVMYGVFIPDTTKPAAGQDSTEIRSIDFATGAVGPLMGGRRYYITRTISGTTYYGSAAMALSCITNKFYLFSQMGNPGPKDLIAVDPLLPTPTTTVIHSTLPAWDNYHIVKTAISPDGYGYAIGVHRSSSATASTFNPLFRYTLCGGVPTIGCSTFELLGYLPSTPTALVAKWELFNGDIAFDNFGNLYFLSSAFGSVSGVNKYKDARLFRINAADIPAVAGTGTIPMSFVADFNALDSTGCSGIAFDPAGNMYFSLKRYTNNNLPTGPFVTQLYNSFDTATANIMAGFGPLPTRTALGDLASGYFPFSVLAKNDVILSGRNLGGKGSLVWKVSNNTEVNYFDVQRSSDGTNFETISTIPAIDNNRSDATYSFIDENAGNSKTQYYRVRQIMKSGTLRYYSNVVRVSFNSKISLNGRFAPNPFIDRFECSAELNTGNTINIIIRDQNGRIVKQDRVNGTAGENKIVVGGLSALSRGIYIVELSVDKETIREKLVKQ